MATLISTNPAKDYQKLGSVKVSTLSEIKKKVALANQAKKAWKELGAAKRAQILKSLYKAFKKHYAEMALLTTREMGRPISETLGDQAWDMSYFGQFLSEGPKYLQDEVTHQDKKGIHKIVYEPYGTTALIVPWNFPFANWLWGVIPTLVAGNVVVFKHSEECPLMGKLIDKIMAEAKLPKGIFSQVYGDGKVGEMLANQPVDLIWFTGSSAVGKKLFAISGQKFIKSVMELGGSNPAVVFDDVKVDEIVDGLLWGRFANCGQVCDCIKRLLVHEKVAKELVGRLKEKLEKLVIGDPEDKKTQIGSLVAKRQVDLLKDQVTDAVKKGAKVITGGKEPQNLKGAYYLPTLLTNIKPNMRVWQEEVFGPVLPMMAFKTEAEAVKLANETIYGLGAKVYSKDLKRARRVASKIQAGCIDINQGNHWLSCNPFGGYKASGMGREHGRIGFQELTQVKVVAEEK
ncbi:hypothetical protein A2160_04700 [Candidatus Beckwithbacteria bacterium RBG_13_42_9]|uniref:Aldehyde dehydrogenase domain-containing protein n=1 Tax=Candidatus Beckwithbacteria bacterium RBG_13_42_9 TaxID=1797457 RepID=A0A1F5E375_9BACT|nr:MAG: hypothetical protein A2160_04700 [Candidatus Beckwithbacteria bacterium RBG_13_42_9]